MPRVSKLVTGGRYTFPTHNVSPPCPCKPTPWAYSFPTYFLTLIPFLIRTAIPPLLSLARLSSYTRYPGISSCTGDFCSHVSWTHNTSRVCVSRIVFNLIAYSSTVEASHHEPFLLPAQVSLNFGFPEACWSIWTFLRFPLAYLLALNYLRIYLLNYLKLL